MHDSFQVSPGFERRLFEWTISFLRTYQQVFQAGYLLTRLLVRLVCLAISILALELLSPRYITSQADSSPRIVRIPVYAPPFSRTSLAVSPLRSTPPPVRAAPTAPASSAPPPASHPVPIPTPTPGRAPAPAGAVPTAHVRVPRPPAARRLSWFPRDRLYPYVIEQHWPSADILVFGPGRDERITIPNTSASHSFPATSDSLDQRPRVQYSEAEAGPRLAAPVDLPPYVPPASTSGSVLERLRGPPPPYGST